MRRDIEIHLVYHTADTFKFVHPQNLHASCRRLFFQHRSMQRRAGEGGMPDKANIPLYAAAGPGVA